MIATALITWAACAVAAGLAQFVLEPHDQAEYVYVSMLHVLVAPVIVLATPLLFVARAVYRRRHEQREQARIPRAEVRR